jgi:hypothetical protein
MSDGQYARWSPAEDAIVRACYPTQGGAATVTALAAAGYARTPRAVLKRAASLRCQVAAECLTQLRRAAVAHATAAAATKRSGNRPWLPEEDALFARVYPRLGISGTRAALAAAGFTRSAASVAAHAETYRDGWSRRTDADYRQASETTVVDGAGRWWPALSGWRTASTRTRAPVAG